MDDVPPATLTSDKLSDPTKGRTWPQVCAFVGLTSAITNVWLSWLSERWIFEPTFRYDCLLIEIAPVALLLGMVP